MDGAACDLSLPNASEERERVLKRFNVKHKEHYHCLLDVPKRLLGEIACKWMAVSNQQFCFVEWRSPSHIR